jgi:hypothetical protein
MLPRREVLGIKQFVTVYMYVRDADGKLVKRNKTEYKKVKYGKYYLLNRPPMMYIEASYEGGGTVTIPFQRTGPDEYTEYLKQTEETEDATKNRADTTATTSGTTEKESQ